MSRKLLDAHWRSFAESVLPVNAPMVQRMEMRRAFYAGARALLTGIMTNLGGGDDATPGDLSLMNGLVAELRQFERDLREGRA